MSRTLYEVLGVEPTASAEEIKRAFRASAKATHPDHHPNDPDAADRFKVVSEAYSVLSDVERRRRYDAEQAPAPSEPPSEPAPAPRPPPAPGQPWGDGRRESRAQRATPCMDCGRQAHGQPRCLACQAASDLRTVQIAARARAARSSMTLARSQKKVQRHGSDQDLFEQIYGDFGCWGRDGLPRW
jgi:curved DNA-binding protein CbpA